MPSRCSSSSRGQVGLERDAVLESVDQTRPPGGFRGLQVRDRADAAQYAGIAVDLALETADAHHGLREGRVRRRRADRQDRHVHGGEAGVPDVLQEGLAQRHAVLARRVARTAEPVDHDRRCERRRPRRPAAGIRSASETAARVPPATKARLDSRFITYPPASVVSLPQAAQPLGYRKKGREPSHLRQM